MPACPRCDQPLQGGFVLNNTGKGLSVSEWIEGAPEKNFWTGIKTSGRRRIRMYAWRCPACAEVRFFAPEVE
jgi:hypothetical protein